MRLLRPVLSLASLCLAGGLAGGLGLGYVLSRQGGWLTPAPWAIYAALLALVVLTVSWLDEKRSARVAEAAWPLPAGFAVPGSAEEVRGPVEATLLPEDAEIASLETTLLTPEISLAGESATEAALAVEIVEPAVAQVPDGSGAEGGAVDTWTADGNRWVLAPGAPSDGEEALVSEEAGEDVPVAEVEQQEEGGIHAIVPAANADEHSAAGLEKSWDRIVAGGPIEHGGMGGGGEER